MSIIIWKPFGKILIKQFSHYIIFNSINNYGNPGIMTAVDLKINYEYTIELNCTISSNNKIKSYARLIISNPLTSKPHLIFKEIDININNSNINYTFINEYNETLLIGLLIYKPQINTYFKLNYFNIIDPSTNFPLPLNTEQITKNIELDSNQQLLEQISESILETNIKSNIKSNIETNIKSNIKSNIETHGETNGETLGETNGETHGETNGETHGEINGETNGEINGATNGDANIGTNKNLKDDGKNNIIFYKKSVKSQHKIKNKIKLNYRPLYIKVPNTIIVKDDLMNKLIIKNKLNYKPKFIKIPSNS